MKNKMRWIIAFLTMGFCVQASAQYSMGQSDRYARNSNVGYGDRYYENSGRMHPGFPKQRPATGREVFLFNTQLFEWGAYDPNGRLIRTGRASGGSHYCPDVGRACKTPSGKFSVYNKGNESCRSSVYPKRKNGRSGGARMPHCMFFHRGYAIHGSNDVPMRHASHGCIRVHPSDAAWLSKNFIRHGTHVIVTRY